MQTGNNAFYKYHGAGNDFIMIDNRDGHFDIDNIEKIKLMCHRRFGVGADGIMLLTEEPEYDFGMIYINSDGTRGAMCGNGARCLVHFAHNIAKVVKDPKNPARERQVKFLAVDGEHEAEILENGLIKLKMQNMNEKKIFNGVDFINCGTAPHYVKFVENISEFPVIEEGRKIRYTKEQDGNVNFVEVKNDVYNVRTYERGVEDETMACGTGSTSVAIISHMLGKLKENVCHIKAPGGELKVEFTPPEKDDDPYTNIWLTGPAVCVFKGEWVN